MCQLVTGDQITLKRRRAAWKVFAGTPAKPKGVYYSSAGTDVELGPHAPYEFDTVYSAIPTHYASTIGRSTSGGFHVFATKEGAEAYRKSVRGWVYGRKYILQVQVWGQALPFKSASGHKGWAVENMLLPGKKS